MNTGQHQMNSNHHHHQYNSYANGQYGNNGGGSRRQEGNNGHRSGGAGGSNSNSYSYYQHQQRKYQPPRSDYKQSSSQSYHNSSKKPQQYSSYSSSQQQQQHSYYLLSQSQPRRAIRGGTRLSNNQQHFHSQQQQQYHQSEQQQYNNNNGNGSGNNYYDEANDYYEVYYQEEETEEYSGQNADQYLINTQQEGAVKGGSSRYIEEENNNIYYDEDTTTSSSAAAATNNNSQQYNYYQSSKQRGNKVNNYQTRGSSSGYQMRQKIHSSSLRQEPLNSGIAAGGDCGSTSSNGINYSQNEKLAASTNLSNNLVQNRKNEQIKCQQEENTPKSSRDMVGGSSQYTNDQYYEEDQAETSEKYDYQQKDKTKNSLKQTPSESNYYANQFQYSNNQSQRKSGNTNSSYYNQNQSLSYNNNNTAYNNQSYHKEQEKSQYHLKKGNASYQHFSQKTTKGSYSRGGDADGFQGGTRIGELQNSHINSNNAAGRSATSRTVYSTYTHSTQNYHQRSSTKAKGQGYYGEEIQEEQEQYYNEDEEIYQSNNNYHNEDYYNKQQQQKNNIVVKGSKDKYEKDEYATTYYGYEADDKSQSYMRTSQQSQIEKTQENSSNQSMLPKYSQQQYRKTLQQQQQQQDTQSTLKENSSISTTGSHNPTNNTTTNTSTPILYRYQPKKQAVKDEKDIIQSENITGSNPLNVQSKNTQLLGTIAEVDKKSERKNSNSHLDQIKSNDEDFEDALLLNDSQKMPQQPHRKVFLQKEDSIQSGLNPQNHHLQEKKDSRTSSSWTSIEEIVLEQPPSSVSVNEQRPQNDNQINEKQKEIQNEMLINQNLISQEDRITINQDQAASPIKQQQKDLLHQLDKVQSVNNLNQLQDKPLQQDRITYKDQNQVLFQQQQLQSKFLCQSASNQNLKLNANSQSFNHHNSLDDDLIFNEDAFIFQVPDPEYKLLGDFPTLKHSTSQNTNSSQASPAVLPVINPTLINNNNNNTISSHNIDLPLPSQSQNNINKKQMNIVQQMNILNISDQQQERHPSSKREISSHNNMINNPGQEFSNNSNFYLGQRAQSMHESLNSQNPNNNWIHHPQQWNLPNNTKNFIPVNMPQHHLTNPQHFKHMISYQSDQHSLKQQHPYFQHQEDIQQQFMSTHQKSASNINNNTNNASSSPLSSDIHNINQSLNNHNYTNNSTQNTNNNQAFYFNQNNRGEMQDEQQIYHHIYNPNNQHQYIQDPNFNFVTDIQEHHDLQGNHLLINAFQQSNNIVLEKQHSFTQSQFTVNSSEFLPNQTLSKNLKAQSDIHIPVLYPSFSDPTRVGMNGEEVESEMQLKNNMNLNAQEFIPSYKKSINQQQLTITKTQSLQHNPLSQHQNSFVINPNAGKLQGASLHQQKANNQDIYHEPISNNPNNINNNSFYLNPTTNAAQQYYQMQQQQQLIKLKQQQQHHNNIFEHQHHQQHIPLNMYQNNQIVEQPLIDNSVGGMDMMYIRQFEMNQQHYFSPNSNAINTSTTTSNNNNNNNNGRTSAPPTQFIQNGQNPYLINQQDPRFSTFKQEKYPLINHQLNFEHPELRQEFNNGQGENFLDGNMKFNQQQFNQTAPIANLEYYFNKKFDDQPHLPPINHFQAQFFDSDVQNTGNYHPTLGNNPNVLNNEMDQDYFDPIAAAEHHFDQLLEDEAADYEEYKLQNQQQVQKQLFFDDQEDKKIQGVAKENSIILNNDKLQSIE